MVFLAPSVYPPRLSYGVFWKVCQAVHAGFPKAGDGWIGYSQVVDGFHEGESESCAEMGLIKSQL